MADFNRRNSNLDDFVGLNWSCWVDRANISPSDAGSDVEDGSKYGRIQSETMTLRKEDMQTYGHCPAHDDFYLVVCSQCGQVVKPDAFEKHCERRHGLLTKMCGQSFNLVPQQRPRPGQPPSNHSCSREQQKDGPCHEDGGSSAAELPVHQNRPSKREAVSLPSVERLPQENPHQSLSMPRNRLPLPPGHCSSSTPALESSSGQRSTDGQASECHPPLRGTRTYSRIYKNTDKKDCDLNKHCRILDPERKKLSSRELKCHDNAIGQQQKSMGKPQTPDHLAVEQRISNSGRDMEQLLVKFKDKEQHMEAFEEKITQGSRHNGHILSKSRGPEENFSDKEGESTVQVEAQPPYPFNQSLLSSEESEDDEQEENTDLPASTWHPKPLGLCTFGCRTLGCSIFSFDRRLHHLRFAFNAMLEHHVSTHLWKKMPQVSSELRSCHVTPPTVRKAERPFKSSGSLSLESTSLGQLGTKSQLNSRSTKPPSSTSSLSLGPRRWRNNVGHSSKAQLKEVVPMQDANTAQKATRLPHSSEDKSSRYIRDAPLHEKGQPQTPSSQKTTTGTFSRGQTPCPPLHLQTSERQSSRLEMCPPFGRTDRSPRSRGRSRGVQQKIVGYEVNGHGQKRKGSSESPPMSSSLSTTSKCKRLSSPSCSSFIA